MRTADPLVAAVFVQMLIQQAGCSDQETGTATQADWAQHVAKLDHGSYLSPFACHFQRHYSFRATFLHNISLLGKSITAPNFRSALTEIRTGWLGTLWTPLLPNLNVGRLLGSTVTQSRP